PKGGHANAAMQPIPEAWRAAAAWTLTLPKLPLGGGVDDWLLQIDAVADMGRLFAGTRMLDDWYVNGQAWEIGVKGLGSELKSGPLRLSLLPLRADAPIYWPREHKPDFGGKPQIADLRAARLIPVYRARVHP
ncbi:MAG: glycoside hydrolase family 35, partial [Inhella sp.]